MCVYVSVCGAVPGQEHIPIDETRNKREGLPRAR